VFLPARTRCLIFFASGDWETKAFSDVRVEATLLFVFFEDLGMCPVPERCSLYLRAYNRATNPDLTSETDGLGVNRREILGDGVGAHVV
jgi:hypothetical protein